MTHPRPGIARHGPELLAAAMMLAGCATAPQYAPPRIPELSSFTSDAALTSTAKAPGPLGEAQAFVRGPLEDTWWRVLGSPELDAWMEEALRASPTLAAAERLQAQAQALFMVQSGSTEWPQADLNGAIQRQQVSPSSQGLQGSPRAFGLYSANIGVHYRVDFGGSTDSALRALAARTDIRRYELSAARHALAANVATAAITRARLAAQIAAQTELLRAQEDLVRLAGIRARLGHAPPEEVSGLIAQAELLRAALPPLQKQLQQTEHGLAVLAGRQPTAAVPAFELTSFRLPERLPVSVPSEWARHRPDIQAAEAAMRVAHGEMGVAYGHQYPQLNLSANLGSQALTTAALFGTPAAVWNTVGQLSQPLFNAGLPAERRAAEAGLEAAEANYQRVVLEALRNVTDALRAIEHDALLLSALSRSTEAAQEQHRVVERQYRSGVASSIQLRMADQALLQARSALIAARAQRLTDTVALSAALAGDPMPRGANDSEASNSR